MSEFLHHVVENREYIQRDMALLSESDEHDPWEFRVPIPYSITNRGNQSLADAYRRLVLQGMRNNNG